MRKPTRLRSLDARTSVETAIPDATEMETKQITLEIKLPLHRTRQWLHLLKLLQILNPEDSDLASAEIASKQRPSPIHVL